MSVAVDLGYDLGGLEPPLRIPMDRLRSSERVRSGGLDEHHISVLMETVDQWPPIVVWGDDAFVVDGAHRVEAARRLGRRSISAERFDGTREEAFVEAVRRNVNHGLPLGISDRRRAALRVLARHADWSDRRIAGVCGLSGKTVARLRREPRVGRRDVVVGMERRIGRDGKIRPVQSSEVRDRIRSALEENPSGSLRTIAAMAGASPETVRAVRAGLKDARGSRPTATTGPGRQTETEAPSNSIAVMPANGSILVTDDPAVHSTAKQRPWVSDPALLSCGDGGAFARWIAGNRIGDEWHQHLWTVPVGRIYEVVDEARRRAASWTAFASALERRIR